MAGKVGDAHAGMTWTYSTTNTNSAQATGTPQYTVSLKANIPYVITTCGNSTTDTYVRLKNSAGTQVAYSDDASITGCSTQSRITYTPTSSGTYTIWAGCYGATTCSGTVKVHMPVKLDVAWGGSAGTVVGIHGHGNCTASAGTSYDSKCGNSAVGYWLNSTEDGGNGYDMLDDATTKVNADGTRTYYEALSLRWEGTDQGNAESANDVAYCLVDLRNGTNFTGCNAGNLTRTSFRVFAHSQGGALLDRIFSTGWWSSGSSNLTGSGGAIVGNVGSIAGALAGSKDASALYGVDGAGSFCSSLVSFLAGWYFKDAGNATLTRGAVIGEANNGRAGKSPRWFYKVTTTGGSGSCNNNNVSSVSEHANDTNLGILCGCVGYSDDDDSDGILWMYDTDPTANPSTSGGGKTRSQYTGYYWHWVASFANHSHNRNDAYTTTYGTQTATTCNSWAPGTCVGQFMW